MPYRFFHALFPKMAEEETRSITVPAGNSQTDLPAGDYAFCEMFCDEPGCDCRRVFFYVLASFRQGPEAVIAWGWESPQFYVNWMGDDDPLVIADLMGPCLNITSPQTELSRPLLDLARDVLLQDKAYVERVKRHYRLFRERIDGKPKVISLPRKRRKIKKRRSRKP